MLEHIADGVLFRCDHCKRSEFVGRGFFTDVRTPPAGWQHALLTTVTRGSAFQGRLQAGAVHAHYCSPACAEAVRGRAEVGVGA